MNVSVRRQLATLVLVLGFLLALVSGRAAAQSADSWGFAPANLDKTCKPCEDFYQFAMGGWMKTNPIPAEYPTWGSFTVLTDKNQTALRTVVEAAAKAHAAPGTNEQKIGDFYAGCMDSAAIETAGLAPLKADLAAIEAIRDTAGVEAQIAKFHSQGVGAVFAFGSTQDFKDSTRVIPDVEQGGLGLPDRDYYTRDDVKSKQLRLDYAEHVRNLFKLAGDTDDRAAAEAQTVLKMETALAGASLTNVQLRDPQAVYHKLSLAELQALTPDFSWESYFTKVGAPGLTLSNVGQPDFFKEVNRQLTATPAADWKVYFRWHLLHTSANLLPEAFVQENFAFYGQKLSGSKKIQPRWKRCVQSVNRNLGEALGQLYVEKYFPPEAKAHAREMVANLIAALREDIPTLHWMGAETKKAAIEKLGAFQIKIGYPDRWRDYSKLQVRRADYLENVRRSAAFEVARDLAKIGKPVDRAEWGMTPPTVNAYYNPTLNEIVFPAGILQPPFFDPKADDAVNYGGMGAGIGHEITHGFDDQGSQFDAQGNLKDWWKPDDRKNFDERATCVREQFDAYEVEPGLHENGKLVLGESIADLGGLAISYAAYERSIEKKPAPKSLDGFTPEQRFFLGWAQVWGANLRPEFARLMANSNPHPVPRFRVNGPVSNMEEFAKAFGCTKGQPMVREKACKIW